jgi:hypothetical protein
VSDTRTIRSYGPDRITIEGLTKGPRSGWSWDGSTLSHPIGVRMRLAPDAADRVTAAVAAYQPTQQTILTGLQISQLPEAERKQWADGIAAQDDNNGYGGYTTDDGVHVYTHTIAPIPGVCEFATSEVAEITRGR